MEETDLIVVGAGVIGLAIARRLSRSIDNVIVIEKHASFGRETSSRNSEVIHAGIYYSTDSLKARLCVDGNRQLYEFCAKYGVAHRKTGKLIVGNTESEVSAIEPLLRLGTANGAPGLYLIDEPKIERLEPHINGKLGLFSPSSGILDTHALMAELERQAEASGVMVAYGCEVIAIDRQAAGFEVQVVDTDGERMRLKSRLLVNAAGLCADRIAEMSGIDIDAAGYRLSYCKGEYFSVASRHRGRLKHLVYPPPTTVSLGTHVVLLLDGGLKLGPNAFYVDEIDYQVNPDNHQHFYESAQAYFPFITYDDLAPDMAGIRPKLHKEHEAPRDFLIAEESTRGLPGLVNLIGMESPGLTSCLTVAQHVEQLVRGAAG